MKRGRWFALNGRNALGRPSVRHGQYFERARHWQGLQGVVFYVQYSDHETRPALALYLFLVLWAYGRGEMDPSFTEKVDLAAEQEPYYNVITQAVRVLVSGLETRVEPAFRAMSAINWGSCEMVGEESNYVRSIHDAFQGFVPNIRSLLSTLYFR